MPDYDRLYDFLRSQKALVGSLALSFGELEGIVEGPLPNSARRHRAWWANTRSHSYALRWLRAGWKVAAVDMNRASVVFERVDASAHAHRTGVPGDASSLSVVSSPSRHVRIVAAKTPDRHEFVRGCEEYEKREKRDAMYKVATFLLNQDVVWGKPPEMTNALGVLLLTWNQAFYRYGLFDFDVLERWIAGNLTAIDAFRKRDIFTLTEADGPEIQRLFKELLKALQIDAMRFSDENSKRWTMGDLKILLRGWGIVFSGSTVKDVYLSIKDDGRIRDSIAFADKEKTESRKSYLEITISKLGDAERRNLETTGLASKSPVAVAKALHLLAPAFFPIWDQYIAGEYGCDYDERPAEKYFEFCTATKEFALKAKEYTSRTDKTLIKLIDQYNYSKYTERWI